MNMLPPTSTPDNEVPIDPASQAQAFPGYQGENGELNSLAATVRLSYESGAASGLYNDYEAAKADADPSSPLLTPDQANAKYGVKDQLTFDRPVTEAGAQFRHNDYVYKQNLQARSQAGDLGWTSSTAAGLIGSIADPVNAASMMIPVLGEERAASLVAKVGLKGEGALTNAASRFVQGAAGGGVGGLAVTPIQAFSQEFLTGQAYTPGQFLEDTATNAVGGGILHSSLGFLGDSAKYLFAAEEGEINKVGQAATVARSFLTSDTKASMLRAAFGRLFNNDAKLDASDVAEADPNFARAQATEELFPSESTSLHSQLSPGEQETRVASQLSPQEQATRQQMIEQRANEIQQDALQKAKDKATRVEQIAPNTAEVASAAREQVEGGSPTEPPNLDTSVAERLTHEDDLTKYALDQADAIDSEASKAYDEAHSQTAEGESLQENDRLEPKLKAAYDAATQCVIGAAGGTFQEAATEE